MEQNHGQGKSTSELCFIRFYQCEIRLIIIIIIIIIIKVRDFVEAGAKEALTPSDVIADSDITFSCVADPQAAKELVFGNCGVLQEINTTKVCFTF